MTLSLCFRVKEVFPQAVYAWCLGYKDGESGGVRGGEAYFLSFSGLALHFLDTIRSWNKVTFQLKIMGKNHDTKEIKLEFLLNFNIVQILL